MNIALQVVNVRNERGDDVVYVGRDMPGRTGSPLGNPYHVGPNMPRGEAAARFRNDLPQRLAEPAVAGELDRIEQRAVATGSLKIGCWCAPAACHAEAIADTIAQRLRDRGHVVDVTISGRDRGPAQLSDSRRDSFAVIGSRNLAKSENADRAALLAVVVEHTTRKRPELECRSGRAVGADTIGESAYKRAGGKWMEVFRPETSRDAELAKFFLEAALANDKGRFLGAIARNPIYLGLHARNMQIILGPRLDDPVLFVIASAKKLAADGLPDGGTRTGYLLATQLGIPCFNIDVPSDIERLRTFAHGGYQVDPSERAATIDRVVSMREAFGRKQQHGARDTTTRGKVQFVLGAADPEMDRIEALMKTLGLAYGFACDSSGRRCHPGSAYQAVSIQTVRAADGDVPVAKVECDGPALVRATIAIDHHRPGDAGFGAPPKRYASASSLGQVVELLRKTLGDDRLIEAKVLLPDGNMSADLRNAAAADHALLAAYRGHCPGVDPKELLRWRTQARAQAAGGDPAVLADRIRVAIEAIATAETVTIGAEPIGLVRSTVPELAEAAAASGRAILSVANDPDGCKVLLQGASSETVDAWSAAQKAEGRTPFGDRDRGYAGVYLSQGHPLSDSDKAAVRLEAFVQQGLPHPGVGLALEIPRAEGAVITGRSQARGR